MAEENKALVRRWFEYLFNEGNLDVADEIIAPDHLNHDPALPDLPIGPEGQKQLVNLYRSAFPDARITIEEQVAEGDYCSDPLERAWHTSGGAYGRCSYWQAGNHNGDRHQPHL